MPSRSSHHTAIDRQLLADPAIAAAIGQQQMWLWQQTIDQVRDSRTLPSQVAVSDENSNPEPTKLPWGSKFSIAIHPVTGERHATVDLVLTCCSRMTRDLSVAAGAVGPGGTWLKPDCPACLQTVEAWEAANA